MNNMSKMFEKVIRDIGLNVNKRYYQNLVFRGGGMKGVAYLGAIQALEELGILQNIQRTAGASVGAISALLLSISQDAKQIRSYFNSLESSRVPQTTHMQKTGLRVPLKIIELDQPIRLSKEFGWYSSEYFYNWTQDIIEKQCGNRRATFADFIDLGYRELYIIVTNLTKYRSEIFSYKTTPDVAVADAVRMSMSIPLFFNALRFDGKEFGKGDYYVDGGVYDNFPMHVFDDRKYVKYNGLFKLDINYETLGLYLYPSNMTNLSTETTEETQKSLNLVSYLELLAHNFYGAQQTGGIDNSRLENDRTIRINDCGVSTFNFNLSDESEEYKQLEKEGYEAVMRFFKIKSKIK